LLFLHEFVEPLLETLRPVHRNDQRHGCGRIDYVIVKVAIQRAV